MTASAVVRAALVVSVLTLVGCAEEGAQDLGPVAGRTSTVPPSTTVSVTSVDTTAPQSTTDPPSPSATQPTTTAPPEEFEPRWTSYSSATYKVTLRHPPDWPAPMDGEASPPYYFALSAASIGELSLADFCHFAASHRMMPFGPDPAVYTDVEFAGQPACVIEPTGDPSSSRLAMAQVVVRYPEPVEVGSGRYEVFILNAQLGQLSAIAATLRFDG